MTAYRRVYDSRHLQLTAQNGDQLRNPTLGNRAWATFTFFTHVVNFVACLRVWHALRALLKRINRYRDAVSNCNCN